MTPASEEREEIDLEALEAKLDEMTPISDVIDRPKLRVLLSLARRAQSAQQPAQDTYRVEYHGASNDVRLLIDIIDAFIEATGESLDDGDRDVFHEVRTVQIQRETGHPVELKPVNHTDAATGYRAGYVQGFVNCRAKMLAAIGKEPNPVEAKIKYPYADERLLREASAVEQENG
jgi:hypothetical protein